MGLLAFSSRCLRLGGWGLLAIAPFALLRVSAAQNEAGVATGEEPYRFSLAVNEVSLTFHAADAHGLPINDLKLDELRLRDNNRPPRRIVDFRLMQDFPIRAGILVDTSKSMEQALPGNRAISIELAICLTHHTTRRSISM